MGNLWIDVARILVPIEGLAGMIFNLVLIFNIARTYIGRSGRLYYYSCIITAILSFYTALGIVITINLSAIIDGKLLVMFYGPLLFYFPEWINNAILVAFAVQAHTMWQTLPAPIILQWLALSKSRHSNPMKMILAYSLTFVFQALAWYIFPGFLPSDEFRDELAASAHKLQGTNLSEFHLYGLRILDENHLDALDVIIFDLMPSFLVSYTVFVVGAIKIRTKLLSLGASISKRTKEMQLRFFLTQIAQVLLPLILTSFPLGIFSVAALLGRELYNFPIFIAMMMWPMPALTALIYLGFVRKTAIRKASRQSKQSISLSKNSVSQRNATQLTSS